MKLIDKLNPDNVVKLLNNKDESPTNYARAIAALNQYESYWDLPLNDVVTIIRMAELDACAIGISNFINYFDNE
tara:strand:- start:15993 stop:16214 length:222 start_codon:yes stop_codon:yes gene_type:complete